ncbi:TonB-dependent receptor plug domain-containing protein [Roseiterribacter gracilis]|uniref:TonB-dependent receptor plug domain-containing protein n=1 Tax=Roseiterribacter gracilis TaxID=2812848 RepID=UPI003B428309
MSSTAAIAEGLPAASSSPDEIVVVATRAPARLDQIGQSVSVLTEADIRADQALVVTDLLLRTPGISYNRNGGPGETTSLRIRGAESDQTIVLVDGVKLNDPSSTGGGYNFANLVTADITRIEILRGAQSVLWGSQAIGGVVNIITAEPIKPLQADLKIEGGNRGTFSARAGVGGVSENVLWRVAASHYRTSSVSAFDARFGGRERDPYHNDTVSGRLRINLTSDASIDFRGYYSDARNDFDSTTRDDLEYGRTKELLNYTGLNFGAFDGRLKNRLALQYTRTERMNFNPEQRVTTTTFDALGENLRFEYQGTLQITKGWQAVFGAEHEHSNFRSASPTATAPSPTPAKASTDIDSGYAQLQVEPVQDLTLTAGLRFDDHATFGSHTTTQASAAWRLFNGATILRASYGEGFKAPTLFQLFSDFGNKALQPEEAQSGDVGIEQHVWGNRVIAQATWFKRDSVNLINFVSCTSIATPNCANGRFGFYDNVARAEAEGIELSMTLNPIDPLTITANYTYTEAKDRSPGSATFGRELSRRPRRTANATVSYDWPFAVTTSVAVRYGGRSFDNATNLTRLEAYTLLDLRASWQVTANVELYGRVENVTNETYETTFRNGTLGRTGYVGARLTF